MNMENKLIIDGKEIQLSEETVKLLKQDVEKAEESKFATFKKDTESKNEYILLSPSIVEIGYNCCSEEWIGKCLLLRNGYEWEILDNDYEEQLGYGKMLIAKKK